MGGTQTDVVKTTEVTPKPSLGRIVHFVEQNGFHSAADIVEVNLNSTVMLYVKNPELRVAEFKDQIREDQSANEPGTWHWPERV